MTRTRRTLRALAGAGLLALLGFPPAAFAAGPPFAGVPLVEFDSAPYTWAPTPFKLKRAQQLGIEVEIRTDPGVPLRGYLARPDGDRPRAAIVLLHTCAGISEHERYWSDLLVSWGYVVLTVDSLGPRGVEYICDGRPGTVSPWQRALDAYGAKQYLSGQAFVDTRRIGVLGMSHGGMTILHMVKQSINTGLGIEPFEVAVAFYPYCGEPEPVSTPLLILVGSEDIQTPAQLCREYVDRLQPGHPVSLQVFTGAHHLFDHPGIDLVELGYILRSDPEAGARARELTRAFLRERLAR